jgi:hypothetical protein
VAWFLTLPPSLRSFSTIDAGRFCCSTLCRLFALSGHYQAGMPTYKCPEQLLDHLAGGGEHRL